MEGFLQTHAQRREENMFAFNIWSGAALLSAAASLSIAALYTDGRRREIPHWLVAGIVVLWAFAAGLAPHALEGARWDAVFCGLGALAAGFAFHALGWLGGGDGKLLAALALWLGPKDLGLWLMSVAVIGLVLALIALSFREGSFRKRGIPFAWAMVPPAATLLIARAIDVGGR